MNSTIKQRDSILKQYNIMRQAGIHDDWEYDEIADAWYRPAWEGITHYMVCGIFERNCREWLEERCLRIVPYLYGDVLVWEVQKIGTSDDPVCFCTSYIDAQIAAMEWYLKNND